MLHVYLPFVCRQILEWCSQPKKFFCWVCSEKGIWSSGGSKLEKCKKKGNDQPGKEKNNTTGTEESDRGREIDSDLKSKKR